MERVLEVRQYTGDTLIRSQRLTAAILAAAQPARGREPARWRHPPALRVVDGELVLCITSDTRGAVHRGSDALALDAYHWSDDPDFPAVANLPVPADGETVVERRDDTLRMRWVQGTPSTLTAPRAFDSPYWNSLGFSFLAHCALVMILLVQPVPADDPPDAGLDPFLERAAILLPPSGPPRPPRPSLKPLEPRAPARSRGVRPNRALTPAVRPLGLGQLSGALDGVFGESRRVLSELVAGLRSNTETRGQPRAGRGDTAPAPPYGRSRALGPDGFPRLATGEAPAIPRRRDPVGLKLAVPKVCGGASLDCALPKSVIQRVIGNNRAQIRACYERALQRQPSLQGRLLMHWVVGSEGTVSRVRVADDALSSPSVAACVMDRIGSWRFPAPAGGGTVEIRYPFVFRSS